jgi:hypothetical protein
VLDDPSRASSAADDADQLQELIDLLRQPSLTDASAVAAGAPSNSRTLSSGSAASKNIPPSSLAPSNDSQPAPSSSPSPHLVSSGSGANLTGTTSGGSARTKRSKNLEETRLDAFLLKHSKRYEFSTDAYSKLLSQLVESRLLNAEWERQASREHRLRVLRAIRVLSRDPALQEQFLRYRPLGTLAAALHRYTREYFDSEPPYAAESVVEVCSILKRVSSEATQDKRIFEQPLFLRSLVLLLSARDHAVLQAVLVTLVNLSGSQMFVEKAMELPMIEPLLHLLNEFSSAQGVQTPLASSGAPTSSNTLPGASPSPSSGPAASASPFAHSQPLAGAAGAGRIGTPASNPVLPNAALPASSPPASSAATSAAAVSQSYHFLAAELLDLLTEYRECRQEIHLLSGNAVFLRLLHRSLSTASSSSVATPSPSSSSASTTSSVAPPPHEQVLLPVLRCLANQALEPESSREIRVLGGIQLLLGMLNTDSTSSGNRSSSPPLSDALLISACICLTQLALEDENALNMRKSGGVYLLGMLFLKGSPTAAQQQQNQQQQEKASAANNPHPPVYSRDVQSHACRALRFLYSHERNRQLFKRLFPSLPDLFACFIDVGQSPERRHVRK